MKRLLFLCLLFFCTIPVFSQLVRGSVFDGETKKEIPYANVFFNSTTVGVITDPSGNFLLKASGNQRLPIAISAIGYHSLLLSEYSFEKPMAIYLQPKTYELGEVLVKSERTAKERKIRDENLNIFRKEFLGETSNAARSKILNEDDIIFQTVTDTDKNIEFEKSNIPKSLYLGRINVQSEPEYTSFKASSRKPIIIQNDGLGYEITYFLDTFEFSTINSSVRMFGNIIFRDIATEGSAKVKAENKRRLAYLGSTMHFFRQLWSDNLDSAGYVLKSEGKKVLTADSIEGKKTSDGSYINYKKGVYIYYHSKTDRTYFELLRDSAYFDKSGYFDPMAINWYGSMAKQRIADQLPYDYIYKPNLKK
jgi:hypothetical protein